MNILAATLGRFIPRYRTVSQWVVVYRKIVEGQSITSKTQANRLCHIRRLVSAFGERAIGSIRPYEIFAVISALGAVHPVAALRTLIEARMMFGEALLNGWIDINPAAVLKNPRIKVMRRRMSLEDWRTMYAHAVKNSPPWAARLLLLALVTGQRRGDLRKMTFADVWDGHLHVIQQKTGSRIALPLALYLPEIGFSIGDVIDTCRGYAPLNDDQNSFLIRKSTGCQLSAASLSARFEMVREEALPPHVGPGDPICLHEVRSLSGRLYVLMGIDVQRLLGHSDPDMTKMYLNDRGLTAKSTKWEVLELASPHRLPLLNK